MRSSCGRDFRHAVADGEMWLWFTRINPVHGVLEIIPLNGLDGACKTGFGEEPPECCPREVREVRLAEIAIGVSFDRKDAEERVVEVRYVEVDEAARLQVAAKGAQEDERIVDMLENARRRDEIKGPLFDVDRLDRLRVHLDALRFAHEGRLIAIELDADALLHLPFESREQVARGAAHVEHVHTR